MSRLSFPPCKPGLLAVAAVRLRNVPLTVTHSVVHLELPSARAVVARAVRTATVYIASTAQVTPAAPTSPVGGQVAVSDLAVIIPVL